MLLWPSRAVGSIGERQIAAAIRDARPGKTAGPRFDTLLVRGKPAKGSRMVSASEETLYDGSRVCQLLFAGSVAQKA